ncbi:hypothetical protein Q5P01_011292 [Channa striata]|uniref:Ribonuclease A-domain domain-containing protein n=1 Tax=Channa striata TaxID=64152 RepID=A0AA88STA8_CHASR|nr:hypothetical protein Q5P01_011292 [Channa striata]
MLLCTSHLSHSRSNSQEVKCGTVTDETEERLTHLECQSHRSLHCSQIKECWEMAALGAFLTLSICLLFCHQTLAKNDAPCLLSKWNNGFNTFVQRHLPSGTPTSLNQNEWEKFIRSKGCNRPTQSFLHPADLERVKEVCTNRGGKVYKENLCISKQPFTFVTVRSEMGTCGIKSVQPETKHLILACERLDNHCLPVHFEGNPTNQKPDNNAKGCQDPKSRAPSLKDMWLWFLSVLLSIIFFR